MPLTQIKKTKKAFQMPLTQKGKNKKTIPDASHRKTRKQTDQYGFRFPKKVKIKDIITDTSHPK